MTTWIVGLSGKKQSGKSTVADRLVSKYGFTQVSFADPLRAMAVMIDPIVDANHQRLSDIVTRLGWDRAKEEFPEVRRTLQRLGTEAGRMILGEDVWVDALVTYMDSLEEARGKPLRFVISDVRFPNEASFITSMMGELVRIDRPGVDTGDRHPSEVALDRYSFPHRITNDGSLTELHEQIDALAEFYWDLEPVS